MIGRLEYTSCADGLEGIAGFQVRAATTGLAEPLRAAAVRDSVYEPGPGRPTRPTDAELAAFPVAFGCTPVGDGLVLYRSVYTGRDHTGRWGNYVARALMFPSGPQLGGRLPIDLRDDPSWAAFPPGPGDLAPLEPFEDDVSPPPAAASPPLPPGTLAALLAAVRRAAAGPRRSRLVLVTRDSDEAALWIGAVTRSLPRPLALSLSFTTYTSHPESHTALLTCTTPDVDVPAYGDYVRIDLTADPVVVGGAPGPYDQLAAQLWATGSPAQLVQAAERLDPPPGPAELDVFAGLASLFEGIGGPLDWSEPDLLAALELALQRGPGVLLNPWGRVTPAELDDVARWGAVLTVALGHGAPVPETLQQRWIQAAADSLAAGAVPADALPAEGPLHDALAETLLRTVGTGPDLETAVTALTPAAAAYVLRTGGPARLRVIAQVVLARAGTGDPVDVLLSAPPHLPPDLLTGDEWRELGALLWPNDPPTPEQALRLLERAAPDVLSVTGLPDQIVERLIDDAVAGPLPPADLRLAELLAAPPIVGTLGDHSRPTVDAVRLLGWFARRPAPSAPAADAARAALNLGDHVHERLLEQLFSEISGWLLTLAWDPHRELLAEFADAERHFFPAYSRTAVLDVRGLPPDDVAAVITAWRGLPPTQSGRQLSRQLLDEVLPRALRGTGRRHLDRIGTFLPGEDEIRETLADELPGGDWQLWWKSWRGRFERNGLFARLAGRERTQHR